MKAIWNDQVIAEAPKEALIYIERNWYFPPDSVNMQYLQKSDTPYVCPWRGLAQYYNVGSDTSQLQDAAWAYVAPDEKALARVKKPFKDHIAFGPAVTVTE